MPGGPRGYCQYYKETFGPVAAIYAALTPDQAANLDRDFLSFATQNNLGPAGGPAEWDYQYIRVIAHPAGHQGQTDLSGRVLLTTACPDDLPRPPAPAAAREVRHTTHSAPGEWVYRRM